MELKERKDKESYVAPEVEVVGVKMEGMICTSDGFAKNLSLILLLDQPGIPSQSFGDTWTWQE
jgi:hypothetical protein